MFLIKICFQCKCILIYNFDSYRNITQLFAMYFLKGNSIKLPLKHNNKIVNIKPQYSINISSYYQSKLFSTFARITFSPNRNKLSCTFKHYMTSVFYYTLLSSKTSVIYTKLSTFFLTVNY